MTKVALVSHVQQIDSIIYMHISTLIRFFLHVSYCIILNRVCCTIQKRFLKSKNTCHVNLVFMNFKGVGWLYLRPKISFRCTCDNS